MNGEKANLGRCPACNAELIRNRRDEREHFHVALAGEASPDGAYYPDFYHEIDAVWCPSCGLAKRISFPRMELTCTNPEYAGWVAKRATEHQP